jgi:exopolysaccharide production protein ExoZ
VNLSFLLGVLVCQVREYGRRWRWGVLAALAAYLAVVPARVDTLEGEWLAYAPAAAALVWLVTQLPQLPAANPLVRWGEYSYGVYLLHAPTMTGVFYLLLARGWLLDSTAGVLLAGAAALAAGLAFGRLECALYARLRPLVKAEFAPARRLRLLAARLRPRAAGR